MAKSEFDCDKCTNEYVGVLDGKWVRWCKPAVDGYHYWDITWGEHSDNSTVFRCPFENKGEPEFRFLQAEIEEVR